MALCLGICAPQERLRTVKKYLRVHVPTKGLLHRSKRQAQAFSGGIDADQIMIERFEPSRTAESMIHRRGTEKVRDPRYFSTSA